MQSTADDLGPPGRDNDFGFGLVDADEAVSIAYDPNGGGDTGGGDPPETFDAPSNLLGQVSGSTVSLSWEDNSSLEDGFEVEQGVQSKGIVDWTQVATIAANEGLTATVDLLNVPNGKYRYRVRAIKNDGTNTNWSNEIQLNVGKGGKR